MTKTTNTTSVDATVKKRYVAPEIEVIILDEEARLLSASPSANGSGNMYFNDIEETDW
ncbi:MAG: hypothetical protein J6T60_02510 [Bacteroidales bacterium]|nr:hypothetical protein [Bacteroidales bacterium]